MRVLAKYYALQVPGWLALALVGWLLWRYLDVAAWVGVALLAVFVLKDVVLFPFLRHAYDDRPSAFTGPEALVGRTGVAEEALAPSGWVRVAGERWRADLVGEQRALGPGEQVVVRAVRGLRVQVEPSPGQAQESADT